MKPLFKSKISLWASVLALVVMVAVGATLALMASTSNSVTNTFAAAQVETEIDENLEYGNKIVTIENTGKSPVYVRARIMVSGVAESQVAIVGSETEATDQNKVYLVMPNVGETSDWEKLSDNVTYNSDYYYYKKALNPAGEDGEKTSLLLEKVVVGSGLATQLKEDPNFSVTVYHESVLAINTDLTTISGEDDIDEAFENAKAR